ncbi:PRC-barrel domain-containing protein [Uliginosibacterium sp. H1]|uniref:PRC-barrel domain-containing protein n=1 Tax=Uliginosibacterium sp. H1 TaxID=3114757 RepID=UPI002E1831B0|nr:PRC-barrel domain-containing protein [Uliginosibacterium sp. H1]
MAISQDSPSYGNNRGAAIIGGQGDTSGPGPEIMAADTLAGDEVYNAAGEKLGSIEHIMLDVAQGRIAYAVLSHGGVLGMGEKLHAIPWSALTLDADRKCFVLDIDKERLKASEGFDKDHWPSFGDSRWAADIYAAYGREPYWWDPRAH